MRSLRLDGPVATITAGWRDGEANDGELGTLLGARDINLSPVPALARRAGA